MHQNCVNSVNAAAGRTLTEAQLAKIEERLKGTMKRLAVSDPKAWSAMSRSDQVRMGAEAAMQDVKAEAEMKVKRAEMQAERTDATEQRVADFRQQYGASRSRALVHDMQATSNYVEAIKVHSISRMADLMDAVTNSEGATAGRRVMMFLFDAENPHMTKDLVAEIFGNGDGRTGNKVAQEGAKAWLTVIEELRQRFNAAGGDIRKLLYGYIPQPHDAVRILKAGADAWTSKVLPMLDRAQYLNEDGTRMNDAQVMGYLHQAWETLSSEGMNMREAGAFVGEAARAKKGGEARGIHFKNADSYLQYMGEFGRGSPYDAMMGHIGSLSRSIGLVERYGPNPNAQMRLHFDLADKADGKLQRVGMGLGPFRVDPKGLWNIVNGNASAPADTLYAAGGSVVRNVQVSSKLAGTVIKSLPDLSTFVNTVGYNKLSYWEAIKNLKAVATSADAREFMAMHGLIANSAIHEVNRFVVENIRQTWSGRVANSTMMLSLMNAWDDWLTRAYQMTQMGGYGKLAQKSWGDISQWDRALLERKGITSSDWAVINGAKLDEFNGMKFLTPESIVATGHPEAVQIATKVLAAIREEAEYAVIKPDLLTRGAQTWNGTQAGTGVGEIARAAMMFKSFPIAMITRHWGRMLDAPRVTDGSAPGMMGGRFAGKGVGPVLVNRVAYMGALSVSGMALGAISLQAVQIITGKDPIDMAGKHAAAFWANALAVGGGLGFYGDLVLKDSSTDRSAWDTVGKTLGGPLLGDAADLYALTKGNFDQAMAGKETHAGAEAVRFIRSHLPWVNLWYAKAAIDHAGLHALQENLSPGYLARMRDRAQKDWGQDMWWKPGTDLPDRAPDLGAAVGQR
jgi:hypothetical protein